MESWEGLLLTTLGVLRRTAVNNSPSQDSNHPDDLFQSRYVTPGFKPFSYLIQCVFNCIFEPFKISILVPWVNWTKDEWAFTSPRIYHYKGNKPVPSCCLPLVESESWCKTIQMIMTLSCTEKHNSFVHQDLLWNRGKPKLGNGPLKCVLGPVSRNFWGNINPIASANKNTFQSLKLGSCFAFPYFWNILKKRIAFRAR